MSKYFDLTDIKKIKPNPDNPRVIKNDAYKRLVKSIQDFPEMLELRPIVIDENGVILGGNMRYRACVDAGMKQVPTVQAETLTEEQKREFIIKDNVAFGDWNWSMLASEWDPAVLSEWNIDLPVEKEAKTEGEIIFSNELDQESNYVVLKFSTDIDWLHAQSFFGLKNTYAKRANGKTWAKGMGRVVDGNAAIMKIEKWNNEN